MIERKQIAFLVALAASVPAWATSGEGSGSPFAGDVGNALWTVIIFGLVVVVLGKFAWRPILNGLQAREDFIRESLLTAKREREAAAEQLAAYEEKLHEARAEASAIVDEGRRDAEEVKARIERQAKEEAGQQLERAKREIAIAKDTAIADLYSRAADLATLVAGRILEKEIDVGQHAKLVASAIAELGEAPNHH